MLRHSQVVHSRESRVDQSTDLPDVTLLPSLTSARMSSSTGRWIAKRLLRAAVPRQLSKALPQLRVQIHLSTSLRFREEKLSTTFMHTGLALAIHNECKCLRLVLPFRSCTRVETIRTCKRTSACLRR